MKLLLSLYMFVGLPALAATDLTIQVQTPDGQAVPNAVIMAEDVSAPADADSFDWEAVMAQSDKQFAPYVLIAPVGSEVSFPNRDRMRHHVYSFSKGNSFEIELYGRDESRSVTFEQSGIVAVGCNIHDEMIGYIRVVDTPYAAKTDGTGSTQITGLNEVPSTLRVWHPDMSARDDLIVEVNGRTDLTITLDVDSAALSAPIN